YSAKGYQNPIVVGRIQGKRFNIPGSPLLVQRQIIEGYNLKIGDSPLYLYQIATRLFIILVVPYLYSLGKKFRFFLLIGTEYRFDLCNSVLVVVRQRIVLVF